jgi:hypothetical protein
MVGRIVAGRIELADGRGKKMLAKRSAGETPALHPVLPRRHVHFLARHDTPPRGLQKVGVVSYVSYNTGGALPG